MSDLVLVTGATGFLAQHCIVQLLEGGWRVRGTARSAARGAEVAAILAPHLSPGARARLATDFEVVAADLTADAGWGEAMAGCRFVLHVASPVPRTPPKHDDELVIPARDGALRVLRAARAAGVSRVVLTSSVAAVLYGHDRGRTFGEADWTKVDDPRMGAYERSKTLAERAAWAFVHENPGMELVTINPGLILGPLLSPDWGTSGEVIKKILDRDFPAIPDVHFSTVDVRDVAAAHLAAMTHPDAPGRRFLLGEGDHSMREMATILAEHLGPRGFRVPRGALPGFLMRLVAVWDRTARLALHDLGVPQQVDSTPARAVLGLRLRPLAEMVTSMADSMVAQGVVHAG